MDNHPIPQDVTGFQFRLIGNMTVKQFGYLAAGVVLSVIVYYFPVFLLFKIIFIPLFSFTGFSLAFIPVEGRPLDAMFGYYLKALTSPNQYVFQKTLGHFSFDRSFQHSTALPAHFPLAVQKGKVTKKPSVNKKQQLKDFLHKSAPLAASKTDKKENEYLTSVLANATPSPSTESLTLTLPTPEILPKVEIAKTTQLHQKPAPIIPQTTVEKIMIQRPVIQTPPPTLASSAPTFMPTVEENSENKNAIAKEQQELERKREDLRKKEEALREAKEKEKKDEEKKREEMALVEEKAKKIAGDNQMTHEKVLELEKSLQEMLSQKQNLEQELQKMKDQIAKDPTSQKTFVPTTTKEEPKQTTQYVRQVPQDQTQKKGLPPTPDSPNILLGLVKDSSENILPNILIEVKDKDGNPVRAFKTNQLGQFASATPLSNGTYTIEFEDPNGKNKFDMIELVAKGEILYPIEVISHDLREELRKQLFT